jgi:hypothetical protein
MSEGLGGRIKHRIIKEKISAQPKVTWAAEREYRTDKEEFLKKIRKRMGVFLIVASILSAAYFIAINASVDDWKILLLSMIIVAFLLIVVIPNYLAGTLLRLKLRNTARQQEKTGDWETLKLHAELDISEKELKKDRDDI